MKIAVDFGHGTGQDRGAEGYRNEESTVREFGTLVIEGLKKTRAHCLQCNTCTERIIFNSKFSI